MISRRFWAGLAAAALPATLLLAQSPPAYATVARAFDARSEWGSAPHDGQAHAWGTVTWHDKTKAVITGRINDLCNDGAGDGYGAYLSVKVEFNNGDATINPEARADDNGCADPDGVAFTPVTRDYTDRWIKYIELCADEIDMPFRLYGDRDCVRLYNPYI
jgi:hypothetical protein